MKVGRVQAPLGFRFDEPADRELTLEFEDRNFKLGIGKAAE